MPDSRKKELIDQIREFPDIDVPAGLSDRIMVALKTRQRSWWQLFVFRLSRPRTITIHPLQWATLGALAVVVMAVFSFNRIPEGAAPSPHQTLAHINGDAELHYLLGRRLLADDQADAALVHLTQAANARPDNALYQFWVGVNYWALNDLDQERVHYRTALQLDPDLLPAHVYIGHNYLDRGEWEKALHHYQRVLEDTPRHAEALFNTGMALRKQGRTMMENDAWHAYLDDYDRGERAIEAVAFLNTNGDFTFRRIQLGPLEIVKKTIRFNPHSAILDVADLATLDDIGQVVARNRKLQLHVVAYVENDANLAKLRARAVKQYLNEQFAGLSSQRIKISWFGVSETVLMEDRTQHLDDSIRMFATVVDES
jgi:tetratricopeptide (TPR) repeat protein